jgi:hypothetical protein
MTIDDMIERLMELKSQHGNIEVVRAPCDSCLLYRFPRLEQRECFGQSHYMNYANTPIEGDERKSVIVITN